MLGENLSPQHLLKKTDRIISQISSVNSPPSDALSTRMTNAKPPSSFSSMVSLLWDGGISSLGAASV